MSGILGPTRQLGLNGMASVPSLSSANSRSTIVAIAAAGRSADRDHPAAQRRAELLFEFLAAGGEGVQHVSGFADRPGFDLVHAKALAAGFQPLHEGAIGGVRCAYFDTARGGGSIICEISESDMEGRARFSPRLTASPRPGRH